MKDKIRRQIGGVLFPEYIFETKEKQNKFIDRIMNIFNTYNSDLKKDIQERLNRNNTYLKTNINKDVKNVLISDNEHLETLLNKL